MTRAFHCSNIHDLFLFRTVHCLYYNPGSVKAAEIAREGRSRGVTCEELNRPGLDSLCRQADRYKEHHVHQGIVADVSKLRFVVNCTSSSLFIPNILQILSPGLQGPPARAPRRCPPPSWWRPPRPRSGCCCARCGTPATWAPSSARVITSV